MLVLSQKPGDTLSIGNDVKIKIVRIGPGAVRIGIEAPASMDIVRDGAKKDKNGKRTSKGVAK